LYTALKSTLAPIGEDSCDNADDPVDHEVERGVIDRWLDRIDAVEYKTADCCSHTDTEPVATPRPNCVAADTGRKDLVEEQPDKNDL
jgi:hypothetical protein